MMLIHSPPGICSDFYVLKCVRTVIDALRKDPIQGMLDIIWVLPTANPDGKLPTDLPKRLTALCFACTKHPDTAIVQPMAWPANAPPLEIEIREVLGTIDSDMKTDFFV